MRESYDLYYSICSLFVVTVQCKFELSRDKKRERERSEYVTCTVVAGCCRLQHWDSSYLVMTTSANMLVIIDPPLIHYIPPLPYPIYGHDREHMRRAAQGLRN
jgi:hypothetical protein